MARVARPGVDDLATLYPSVAAEWHPTKNGTRTPATTLPGAGYPVIWQCHLGHEWTTTPNARGLRPGRKPSSCPTCAGQQVLPGFNDLATKQPDIATDWHPTRNGNLQPTQVTAGANQKVWWQCPAGDSYEAVIAARTGTRARGCPICVNQQIIPGRNDLATIHPAVAAEWHPTLNGDLKPTQVAPSSKSRIWWQGATCGHAWQATVKHRTSGNSTGCPICSGHRIVAGFNDLATTHPNLAAQWHPTKNDRRVDSVGKGSEYSAWWFDTECSHEWQAVVYSRSAGIGCAVCHGKTVMVGVNDLATLRPDIAAQWHPTKNGEDQPSAFTVQSRQSAWWMCSRGHEWQISIANRTAAALSHYSQGCLQCAQATTVSDAERDLIEHLDSLGVTYRQHDRRTLPGSEIDIYLPDHKFGIEYNGIYWHSEAAGKGKDYHRNKWLKAQTAGIQLLQIWEDDYKRNPDLVKNLITHKLGLTQDKPVYARLTTVQTVDTAAAATFLNQYHIQGYASGSHYLGLMHAQQLVALLVLKREGKQDLNIIRYATATRVPGGFTKLLTHATKTYTPNRFITFADHCVSDGALYENTGFVADKELAPDYMYLVRSERRHKFGYRLAKFRSDPALKYKPGLTERELATLNGLHRIWDAGKTRYIKDLTTITAQKEPTP